MRLLLASLICLLGLAAQANDRVSGNGGDGIMLGGKLYLLDLVEEGVENDPVFPATMDVHPVISKIIDGSLTRVNIDKTLLKAKLNQVFTFNKVLGIHLAQAIYSYNWVLVNSSLVDIPDEDSVIDYGGNPLVQIAIRRDHSIRISRDAWAALDEKQKVAVVLHEALYSMNKPVSAGEVQGSTVWAQSSPKSRELNGFLFSPSLLEKGDSGIKVIGDEWFPTALTAKGLFRSELGDGTALVDANPKMTLAIELRYKKDEVSPTSVDDVEKFINKVCEIKTDDPYKFMTVTGFVHFERSSMYFDSFLGKNLENSTYLHFSQSPWYDVPYQKQYVKDADVTKEACTASLWDAYNKAREYIKKYTK